MYIRTVRLGERVQIFALVGHVSLDWIDDHRLRVVSKMASWTEQITSGRMAEFLEVSAFLGDVGSVDRRGAVLFLE